MSKTFADALATKELPKSEIFYILQELSGLSRNEILCQKSTDLSNEQWDNFHRITKLRLSGKPLQYIFGQCYFYDRNFEIDPSVLIPRPETELLVDKIIRENKSKKKMKILDIGTGSGCIAIVLALHLDCQIVDAVDTQTLLLASKNAKKHKARVNFYFSDIYSHVQSRYDIIVSNPPYIGFQEFQTLEKQVKDYEPKMALFAKENGTYFYKKILTDLDLHLSYKGSLYLEIGAGQAKFITDLAKKLNFNCQIEKDLNGLDRMAIINSKN